MNTPEVYKVTVHGAVMEHHDYKEGAMAAALAWFDRGYIYVNVHMVLQSGPTITLN